jgi:hypothetical protein
MLKTNSKKARDNIRAYIVNNFDPCGYTDTPPESWPGIAAYILETFRAEKYSANERRYYHWIESDAFLDWAAGLPSILDTCYYYNRSAVDDLGAILEESEIEKARYSESDAEKLLTMLIYRELIKGEKENAKNA